MLIWPLEGTAWQNVELRMAERTREMLIPMLSEMENFSYVTKKYFLGCKALYANNTI